MDDAPLGPIETKIIWVRQRGCAVSGEGWVDDGEYYLDQMGNEYTSPEHLAACAIAKALGVSR